MFYILIEESYSENTRFHKLLDGINSVAKKKHDEISVHKSCENLPDECRIVILIAQSLRWTTDRIEELNKKNIHPLIFGFQYLDTMYKYSSIAPNYTKSAYRITKHILANTPAKTAILGYNEDSLPDRLKYIGIRYAVNETCGTYEVFRNRGDILACLENFSENCEGVKTIVCCNDNVAVMLYNRYPHIIKNRKICSCFGMKISEFFEEPYPACRMDYYKAGVRLAMLYRFLSKEDTIYSTVMTIDMEFIGDDDTPTPSLGGTEIYSAYEVDFYGDKNLRDMESLDTMLLNCDDTDLAILCDIISGLTYEKISEKHFLAINTVKYRVKKMLEAVGLESRRELIALLDEYGVKFKKQNKIN